MKRSALILSAVLLPLQAISQGWGWIWFDNYNGNGSPFAPVYGPEMGDPQQQKWGNASEAIPPGTQTYTGSWLSGTDYSVAAWYSLTPVTDVYALNSEASFFDGTQTTFWGYGCFNAGTLSLGDPEAWPSLTVYLQVRAWDNLDGQLATWDEAWNAALAGGSNAVGWSKVFRQYLAHSPTVPAIGLEQFESFNIFILPEPSTLSLLGLSGLIWFLVRRRS